jgi:hypothetical protein
LTDSTAVGRGATAGGGAANPGVFDHQFKTFEGSTDNADVDAA